MEKIFGDFHVHTNYSRDSSISIEKLIEVSLQKGLNCLAITDHDEIEGAYEMAEVAPFKIIVGEEISSLGGHIIGLFLKSRISPGLSVVKTVEKIREQDGVVVAPHPMAYLCGCSLHTDFINNYELFDAVEVANSNNFLRWDDWRARSFAEQNNLLKIGGSDVHVPVGIGSNIVEMDDFEDKTEFLENLKVAKIHNKLHPFSYFVDVGFYDIRNRSNVFFGKGVLQRKEFCGFKQQESAS